jgi:ElaB/YqjD/DUF883 family membrane-anchored ribosome-binding protein
MEGFAMAATAATARDSTAKGNGAADIEAQLETLRDDIAKLTQQVGALVTRQVNRQMNRAKAKVDSALSDATDTGREAIDAVRDVADTVGEAIEDSLERRPYATLAIVGGIGFLLGAIWRR